MKDCARYQEMISQMADGELTEPHKTELARHIASCPDCRRMYDAFAFISSSLAEGMEEPPQSLRTGISDALHAQKARRAVVRRWRGRAAAFTALAACAALIVLVAARGGTASLASRAGAQSETTTADAAFPAGETPAGETDERAEWTGAASVTCSPQPTPNPAETAPSPSETVPSPGETVTEGLQMDTYGGVTGTDKVPENSFIISQAIQSDGQSAANSEDPEKVSMIRLFSGTVTSAADDTPALTVTDGDSIAFLMEQLACSEAAEQDAVSGDPVFTLAVTAEDGDYVLSVWITDGRLYCRSDRDGVLYVAAGDVGDLMDFIAQA